MTDLQDRLRLALADRYAIEREFGAGGMATVYLAHDLKHDRQPPTSHILPLHDSGAADGFLFYVMPWSRALLPDDARRDVRGPCQHR